MGLRERRAVKEFQDEHYPAQKQRIDEAAGFEVEVEVEWDSLVDPERVQLFNECWPQVYFDSLVEGLKKIAVDDMGREALKEGLKKIVIKNSDTVAYGDRCASFEGGTLTIDHKPYTNVDDLKGRVDGIQKALEDGL